LVLSKCGKGADGRGFNRIAVDVVKVRITIMQLAVIQKIVKFGIAKVQRAIGRISKGKQGITFLYTVSGDAVKLISNFVRLKGKNIG
jgi:hypothetical protein